MKAITSPPSRLIIICCLVLIGLNGSAQIGLKTGLSASSFTHRNALVPEGEYEVDLRPYLGYSVEWVQLGAQKPILSPYVSLYYIWRIHNRFSVVPELSFLQKGVNFNQFEFERIIYQVKTSYLEVPVSIAYSFLKKEKHGGDIYLGAFGALKIQAIKRTASHSSPLEVMTISNVNRVETGVHFGINYKRKISKNYLLVDFRVFQGMSNIFSLPDDQVDIYHEVQAFTHTGFLISIGYEI